ncbi:hypothetical protein KXV85_006066, partial [Aspergillus fumigatus]
RRCIVAQQLLWRRRQTLPGPGTFQRIQENLQPAIDIALGDDGGGSRNPGCQRRGSGLVIRIERAIQFAAGLGQDQLAEQIGPPLRGAKADMPAARMAHQIDRPRRQLLDEGDHVIDMLRHLVVVAHGIPMFGKEVPQAHRDDAVRPRQWAEHRIP